MAGLARLVASAAGRDLGLQIAADRLLEASAGRAADRRSLVRA